MSMVTGWLRLCPVIWGRHWILKQDDVVQSALGSHIYERYVEAKTEWNEYRLYVTQWELNRYLMITESLETAFRP